MKNNQLVYVLTLNWNGKQVTMDCVESVLKSDYPNFRVIVIDNGSNDGSVEALRNKFGNLNPTPYGGAFHDLEEIYIKK